MLFLGASAALVAAAIALGLSGEAGPTLGTGATGPGPPAATSEGSSGASGAANPFAAGGAGGAGDATDSARRLTVQLRRRRSELEAVSRRFLEAFLRYEVGDIDRSVRREIHATATREFARRLLGAPPRPPGAGRFPPRATLRRLDIAFVSPEATLAVASGRAWRAGLPEELAFVFARRPAGWLASEAAE